MTARKAICLSAGQAPTSIWHALRSMAALLALLLAPQAAAAAAVCDYSGFDQPCKVNGGIYRVLIPEGEGPFPVMVYLYGSGGHSLNITSNPIFEEAVVQRGYALIVPAALDIIYVGNVQDSGWSLRNETTQVRDEIAFLREVLRNVGQRFEIDRERIIFVGQSRGAFLIWEIACHNPDLGTAFAVHAGGYLGKLPSSCQRPVRFLHTHGLADPIVPIGGQKVFSGGAYLPPLADSMAMMARTDGCQGPEEDKPFYEFARRSWTGCSLGSSLDLMLHPGGHFMPGIWFRAILDWFEETHEAPEKTGPVARAVNADRPAAQFRGLSGGNGGGSPFKGVPAKGESRLPTQ